MNFINTLKTRLANYLFILCFLSGYLSSQSNIVVDSSLEGHNTSGCDYNNTDIAFNAHYSNVNSFAYNNAGEIDIIKSTSCIGENPPLGATHLGLAHNGTLDRFDQISLNLTTPIVAGNSYDLSFWVDMVQYTTQQEGDVEFGVSTTSTDFGTLIHTESPPLAGGYLQFFATIVPSVGGNYLTIRPKATGASDRCWMHIDGIELIGQPLPFCDLMSADLDTMIVPLDTLSDYTFAVEEDMILTGKILAGSGADTFVDLRASEYIQLNGPFEIEIGTRALLYINACDPSNLPFNDPNSDTVVKKGNNAKLEETPSTKDIQLMTPPFMK